jgi:hypothetical protein
MIGDMKNRARAALVLVACLVGLTGCVSVDADLEVNSNETVSGTLRIGIDKQLVQTSGQSLDQIRRQLESGIQQTATEGVACKAFENDKVVGSDCKLDKVPFEQMGRSTGEGVGFRREGNQFVVTVKVPGLGEVPAGTKPDVKFRITMPGKIVSHDPGASVSGRTATYDSLDELGNVSLRSEAGGAFPLWATIVIAALLLAAVGAVLFFVLRGRKAGEQQPFPGGQYPPGGPWGPQYGGRPGQQPMQYGQPNQPMQYGQSGPPMQYGQPVQYPGGQPGRPPYGPPAPPPGPHEAPPQGPHQGQGPPQGPPPPGRPGQWSRPGPPQGSSPQGGAQDSPQGPPQEGWSQPPQQGSIQPPQQGSPQPPRQGGPQPPEQGDSSRPPQGRDGDEPGQS